MLTDIGVVSYASSGLVSLGLLAVILVLWRDKLHANRIIIPVLASAVWGFFVSAQLRYDFSGPIVVYLVEIIRDFSWLLMLLLLLKGGLSEKAQRPAFLSRLFNLSIVLALTILALLLVVSAVRDVPPWLGYDFRIILQLGLFLLILVFTEQIYRNSRMEERWGIKFLCLGIVALFAYDFYLYSDALLFRGMDTDIWQSRGFVNVIGLLLVGWAIKRSPEQSSKLLFSRNFAFYGAGLIIAAGYLLITAMGGYYLKVFGGEWGDVLRNVFVFSALVLFAALVLSGQMRSRLRVFLDKHFLNDKYNYREEWLGLIRNLSVEDDTRSLELRALQSVAEIMDSPAGSIWVRRNKTDFYPIENINMADWEGLRLATQSSLCDFLETWQWVINLDEYRLQPDAYVGLELPDWLKDSRKAWLVMPLMLQTRLYGFVVLTHPRAERSFGWEDIDLLKTVGRQIATHLAHARSALALVQARQFEAFNRFSAYVIHDLKNLVSQLALLVKNGEKHKHNPAFMDDAMNTVDNAVQRMNRLLAQLRAGATPDKQEAVVLLDDVLTRVVEEKKHQSPVPQIREMQSGIRIEADADRLVTILAHLVQNAQDATPADGYVHMSLKQEANHVLILIEDNGHGMDEAFIEHRLFKPFDTTKGLTGMGIGAHESRAYIEELGGDISVTSQPGQGATFIIKIPLVTLLQN